MTVSIADHDLSAAIISSVKEGTFPDSEDVLIAELPATTLPTLLEEVSEARQQLEVERYPKKLLITLRLTVHYI
jgi:centromere/kinetochore protein ZW10